MNAFSSPVRPNRLSRLGVNRARRSTTTQRACVAIATLVLAAVLQTPISPATAQTTAPGFVRGELIVGYNSEVDRQAALKELRAAKNGFSIRGAEKAQDLTVEALDGSALKLRIQLPAAMQAEDRWRSGWTPFEVVHLAAVDDREAAAPTGWDVVTWNVVC